MGLDGDWITMLVGSIEPTYKSNRTKVLTRPNLAWVLTQGARCLGSSERSSSVSLKHCVPRGSARLLGLALPRIVQAPFETTGVKLN